MPVRIKDKTAASSIDSTDRFGIDGNTGLRSFSWVDLVNALKSSTKLSVSTIVSTINFQDSALKNAANGYAGLSASSLIDNAQIDDLPWGSVLGSAGGAEITVASMLSAVYTLADSATPSVAGKIHALSGGATSITSFADVTVGQSVILKAKHAITITHGASLQLSGSVDFVMTSGDTLSLYCFETGVLSEVGRCAL